MADREARLRTAQGPRTALLLLAALLAGACSRADGPAHERTEDPARPFAWPRDPSSGRLRQVGEYPDELAAHPELFPISRFPKGQMPDHDIGPLGVLRVDADESDRLVREEDFVVVDVRKDRDVRATGVIPGSVHLEYRFEGYEGLGSTALTPESCLTLLERHRGLVLVCNGPRCPRSFNAVLAAVERWGVPGTRVRWLREGTPSWDLCPLVPAAEEPE